MKKVLLAVVAHPDDESFGMGGTLAYYANAGVEVHLICATKGEAGEVAEHYLDGFLSIGDLRKSELECAAKELGIFKIHFLNYRDSGMPGSSDNFHPLALIQAPIEEISNSIALIIRTIKPQVVITFDPIGGYMHPDHIAINKACIRAFEKAGMNVESLGNSIPFSPIKLYFHIFPRGFLKYLVRLMPLFGKDPSKFGKNEDIDLASIMKRDFPVHAKINYRKVALKREKASACHASQGGDRQSGYFLTWILRIFSSNESFMRAFPPPKKGRIERDLFEDI